MDISQWKKQLDVDEKSALRIRVDSLVSDYSIEDVEKIIFSELDDIGLRSEYYLDTMDEIMREKRK